MKKTLLKLTVLAVIAALGAALGGGCGNPAGGGGGGGSVHVPDITAQPQGAVYGKDTVSAPLTVTATVDDGGTLSYQWYQNTENASTGGTAVGADEASYTPPTDTVGTWYYYVVVTNTLGSAAASTASDTAEIEVNNLENAQFPGITTHPQEAFYFKDTTAAALGVTATTSDGGTLSYQWYQNTENASTGGASVGTNEASYTPPTDTVGTWYYYVTVSNTITDNDDGGIKTRSQSSNPARITIATALSDPAVIEAYLAAVPGGGNASAPVSLPVVGMELSASNWSGILGAIATRGKYVDLDLSDCTRGSHGSGGGLYGNGTFDPNNGTSTGKNRVVSLILPEAATEIKYGTSSSNAVFRYFTTLKSVAGGAVTIIGTEAFYGCTSLTEVDLPAATSIGPFAFYGCTGLASVSFPAAISTWEATFRGCTGLTEVDLPAATSIGKDAFSGCTGLASASFPAAISIREYAFHGCTGLTEVDLPAATSIGVDAFSYCTALVTVSLPATLTSISISAFDDCINLTAISVDAANLTYKHSDDHKMLLSKDGATLFCWPAASGAVNLPGITTIGDHAFYGCTGLTSADLPAATSIGVAAFWNCTGLTSVNLPTATSIGRDAFGSCTGLTEVNLPAATSIALFAFAGTGTGNLTITLGAAPPELGTSMFSFVTGDTKIVTITVPDNAAWSGIIGGSFTGAENTTGGPHWGEGFRGKGWESGAYPASPGTVNEHITLTIQTAP